MVRRYVLKYHNPLNLKLFIEHLHLCTILLRFLYCINLTRCKIWFSFWHVHTDLIVVVHGLNSSTARRIFPDEGLNPCPLHWQADSYPLSYQGSPKCKMYFLTEFNSYIYYFYFVTFKMCYLLLIYAFSYF